MAGPATWIEPKLLHREGLAPCDARIVNRPLSEGFDFGLGAGTRSRTQTWVDLAVRIIGGVLGGAAGVIYLLCVFMAVSSRLSTDIVSDPHGYGLIFGTIGGMVFGFVCALVLPLAFPQRRRARAYQVAMLSYLAISALTVLAWISA